jgi:hypothetical protein
VIDVAAYEGSLGASPAVMACGVSLSKVSQAAVSPMARWSFQDNVRIKSIRRPSRRTHRHAVHFEGVNLSRHTQSMCHWYVNSCHGGCDSRVWRGRARRSAVSTLR